MKVYKSTTTVKEVRCVDEKCAWRVRAVKQPQSSFFVIRGYCGVHTCTLRTRSAHHKQATSRVIGRRMHGHIKSSKEPLRPKTLLEFVRNELNLQCSYWKAWKAKNIAQDLVRGTAAHNFAILPSYCYMLKKANDGTVTHIEVDGDNRFKYFFMALGPQIRGFRYMRKVIGIDGAWIKTKFKGVLLVATTQDSEFHTYPLAWGLVDRENNSSWTWFLEKLKELIPDDPNLCFISDRCISIEHAVGVVYPQASHGACYFHVKMNIIHKFKSEASITKYCRAAEAYTLQEFEKHFNELRATFPRVAKYLEDEVRFEKWSRAHFKGNRYEVMTTNIVESVNSMMRSAREYPITALIDFVVETMGQWFMKRRSDSLTMENMPITPRREKILRERWNNACSLTPLRLNVHEYHVKGGQHEAVVNLGARKCQCKVFDVEEIPCVHAIAAAGLLRPLNTGDLVYSYCSKYYSVDYFLHAYVETIYPVSRESEWGNIPEEISSMIVREPLVKTEKGRPKVTRFPSRGEIVTKKRYKCGKCQTVGHTRKTCTKTSEM